MGCIDKAANLFSFEKDKTRSPQILNHLQRPLDCPDGYAFEHYTFQPPENKKDTKASNTVKGVQPHQLEHDFFLFF